jgi:hypothetical protein
MTPQKSAKTSSCIKTMAAPLDKLAEQERPQTLDRAALEGCVGGPFFPGIEASRVMLNATT